MNIAQPIRDESKLHAFKEYYREIEPIPRNYLLISIGLNTALRISDILLLRWEDVYNRQTGNYRTHIHLVEQKTKKASKIYVNHSIREALEWYWSENDIQNNSWLFGSKRNPDKSISRMQAYRIIRKAAEYYQLEGVISCHSLRKTFGYYAWNQGISPVMIMNIYNHSSYQVTKRYLGVEQDDRDKVFQSIVL